MESVKQEIIDRLRGVEEELRKMASLSEDTVSITDYRDLVRSENGMEIWTEAFRAAVNEHKVIEIPYKSTPYYLDDTVRIPSGRRIRADKNARICLTPGCDVLMLRNAGTRDGTHAPIPASAEKDRNIAICGGIWEESRTERRGYGNTGNYDKDRSFYGVSACMFFNNVENLVLTDMTFVHTAGFAVQAGDMKRALFENITFIECFADGLHINGNTEDLTVRNVSGNVGDDLVALNLYDWQNSSVDFGPAKNILCENLTLSDNCRYPAMRIEPGTYYYDDGTAVDCSLTRAIIRNVAGIRTFKLYYQTPPYALGEAPEKGDVGSCDYLFFENIRVDLNAPIDLLPPYTESDEVRGTFAAFELGANIGHISLENIDLTLHKDRYPFSYLLCIGPKSYLTAGMETFDPYLSSVAKELRLRNIFINGEKVTDLSGFCKEIEFDDVNRDGFSTGKGKLEKVTVL